MKKEIQQIERRGLPGGPNEIFTYTTGVFSTEGFRMDSPDVNNYQNIIPSGSITMKERDGSPLRKGPIHGIDNLGNEQIMYPGFDYQFPGNEVTETLLAKMGGGLLDKTIKCGNCGWQWRAADGGSDVMDCHKCGGKGLVKAQNGGSKKPIYVDSYDDPRYKAYNDSLRLYTQGQKQKPIYNSHPEITKEQFEKFEKWEKEQPLWGFDEAKYKKDVKSKKFKNFDDYVYDYKKYQTPEDEAFNKTVSDTTIVKGNKQYIYPTINGKIDKDAAYYVIDTQTGTTEFRDPDGRLYQISNNKIKPINSKYTGLKNPVVHDEISTKALSTGWYDSKTPSPAKTLKSSKSYKNYSHETEQFDFYKKPQQQVIVKSTTTKPSTKPQQKEVNVKPQLQPMVEAINLPPMQNQDPSFPKQELDLIRPIQAPKSYNVNMQRYNMQGPSDYYQANEEGVDYERAMQIKAASDAYNKSIEEKYGPQNEYRNSKAAEKAAERLKQLKSEFNVTSNYKFGGDLFHAQNGTETWKKQEQSLKVEKLAKLKKLLEKDEPVFKKKTFDEKIAEKRAQENTKTVQKDNTNVRGYNKADKHSNVARNLTKSELEEKQRYEDEQIAKERQSRIDAQAKANEQPFDWSNFRQSLADRSQATGDALRVSNEPNFFDDYLNPAVMIGSMADNLGQAPLRAQQEDSYMPYVTSIGTPLAVGALAGFGAQSTGQFVNNLANPLAGTGDLAKGAKSFVQKGMKQLGNVKTSISPELRQGLQTAGPSFGSSVDNINFNIAESAKKWTPEIQNITKKEIDYITSPEYLTRRMANTGETKEQVIKSVDKILKNVNKTEVRLVNKKDLPENHGGNYLSPGMVNNLLPEPGKFFPAWKNTGIINVSKDGFMEQTEGTLNHEIKHAFSPVSTGGFTYSKYKNYPTIEIKIPNNKSYERYLNLPEEQQVRFNKIKDYMEEAHGIKKGTYFTDDDITKLIDDIDTGKINSRKYSDVLDMIHNVNPEKASKKYLKEVLNESWAIVPGAIGIGTASQIEQKREGGFIKDNIGQWAHPGKITQIAQEGQEITVDQGDGIKRNILTDSSEYAKLYNEGRIGVQNDDNTISFNPFNEVVVTPYDNQYPFYQELSDEEKKYFNSDSAIGRAVRRKAYTKAPLSEDVTNIAAPIIYGTAAAMLAPYALAPLAAGLEFAGAAAAPYIEGALATSLPGMSSIPGATVGNAINAGFAGHGLANVGPDAVEMYNNPSWENAFNVGMDALEIAPVVGPTTRNIGKGLSTTRSLTTENIANDYANPIKNLATTFKNRNKKLITVGAENLDKELLKKIQQLESPEGFNRLVVQEAEMLKRDFPVLEKYGDIEKQAVSNAHTRISELYKTALQGNFNKNYLEAKKLNSELTPNKFGIPRNNAFFRTGLGSSNYSDNAINLSKEPSFRDDLFSKTYYGTEMPGEIAIGREYAEGMPVYDHEINHALQNARNTTLDDLLRKYFNNSENLSKNFSEKTKKAYNYFRKNKQGMPSREPSSFLAEARRSMLERGLIKDIYEPMTPKKVFEAMKHFKNEPFINPYTEQSYHRIFDFADDHPKTLKFLSDSFNKLLTLGPIGLGATSQMGEEELVPEMKEGGEPNAQNTTTPSPLVEYVVKKGDTLSKIAAANNTSIASIMRNNESISDPNIISINQKINLVNKNVYTPKEEVYKDWNTIRDKKDKINKLSDEQKIVSYYNDKPEDTYLIVDKKNAVMKLYTGGNLTKSFEVGVGQNPGDAQTVTKVKNGKTDWSAGNKSTGAGIYTISNINPASTEYYNEPAFNLKNENGIEVATTIHGTPKPRRIKFNNGTVIDNRMSNGCINGKCEDLKELYGQLDLNTKVYILPEDAGNNFQIIDGKPALRVSSKNRQRYNQYIDQTGTKQKGQGANQTTNTLVYKPIKAYIDETKFKNDVFQWNDFNDEKEYNNTTKPFIVALTTRKQDVMKAAKISSDVYNELAKMSFGIYGAESNYGDTHSAAGNLARATNKVLDPKSSSSPDYKSKATTYGANENTRSVGLTQIRWNYLNEDEKKALKEVGITSNKDFLDPKKAAIGTVTILGVRYNQQLNDKQKQDVWTYLPTKWNSRSNYSSRVKSNASYLSFKQLDKKQEGGESKPGPLMQAYNSLLIKKKMGGDIPNKKEFGGQLNSGNISMYKDYIKGNVSNEEQAIKNYDKLNRIYYSKAKELGMTAANYIMTYL